MGATGSVLFDDSYRGNLPADINPVNSNWLTAHQDATHLELYEVERLWERFRQLSAQTGDSAPQQSGTISERNLAKFKDDFILKQVFAQMPKDLDGGVTFLTFCNAMKWSSNAQVEAKLRAMFRTLNHGRSWDLTVMRQLVSTLYPDERPECVQLTANEFVQQLDTAGQGFVDEDQFVAWMRTQDYNTVCSLLEFHVVPPELLADLRQDETALVPSRLSGQIDTPASGDPFILPPTVEQMREVAQRCVGRDWLLVVNKLGYTTDEVAEVRQTSPFNNSDADIVYELLRRWLENNPMATTGDLEIALRESNMADIASILL